MNHSGVSLTSLLIGIVIAFALGAAWKHNRLARADLIGQKAKIKGLRRLYWIETMIRMIKWALIVTLVIAITSVWAGRDALDDRPTPLVPSPSKKAKP